MYNIHECLKETEDIYRSWGPFRVSSTWNPASCLSFIKAGSAELSKSIYYWPGKGLVRKATFIMMLMILSRKEEPIIAHIHVYHQIIIKGQSHQKTFINILNICFTAKWAELKSFLYVSLFIWSVNSKSSQSQILFVKTKKSQIYIWMNETTLIKSIT